VGREANVEFISRAYILRWKGKAMVEKLWYYSLTLSSPERP